MKKNIIIVPPEQDFIPALINRFFDRKDADFSSEAVVFPGRRAFLYFNRALALKLGRTFFPPREFTMAEFMDFIREKGFPGWSAPHPLDAAWMLFEIIRDMKENPFPGKEETFESFYPWAGKLFEFLDLIDRENIPASRLKNLGQNALIGYDVPDHVNRILSRIFEIREEFHKRLKARKSMTKGLGYLLALESLKNLPLPGLEKVYFAGLLALTNVEREVMGHFWEKGLSEIIWNDLPENRPAILGPLKEYFHAGTLVIGSEKTKEEPCFHLYSGSDTHSLAAGAYEVLKKKRVENTVVVLPLSDTLFPFLSYTVENLKQEGLIGAYNISMQYPLSRTSLFNLVKQVLELQRTCRRAGGQVYYSAKQYADFLSQPFVKNLNYGSKELVRFVTRSVMRALKGEISESRIHGLPRIRLEEIEEDMAGMKSFGQETDSPDRETFLQALKDLHGIFFRNFETATTLEDLSVSSKHMLDHIRQKSDIGSYLLSGEVFNCLFECFGRLKRARVSSRTLQRPLLLEIFIRNMESATLSFDTRPIQDLEIIGMLETRNLNFKNVLILDVQEKVLPREKALNPLVPLGVYAVLGLPGHEQEQEMYEFYFQRLVKSAEEVHLFYIRDEEKERSRYIEALVWEHEKKEKKLGVLPVRKISFPVTLGEPVEKNLCIAKDKAVLTRLREMTFSHTSIQAYLECRLKFYFKYILRLEEQGEIAAEMEGSDRGILVHHILKETYDPFRGRELTMGQEQELVERLQAVLADVFGRRPDTGENYVFRRITEEKLKRFIKNDLEKNAPFRVHDLEKYFEAELVLGNHKVRFRGQADRINRTAEGFVILDYKTGALPDLKGIDPALNLCDLEMIRRKIPSLQLPLYILLFLNSETPAVPEQADALFVSLLDHSSVSLYKGLEKTGQARKEILEGYYGKALAALMDDLLNPAVPFKKYEETDCLFCPYTHLCGTEGQKEYSRY